MKLFTIYSETIPSAPPAGFTLVELMIVIAIAGILASLGIPNFVEYREKARVQVAVSEIKLIATEILNYQIDHDGLPNGLDEVHMDDIEDPWGRPYVYLKLAGSEDEQDKKGKQDKIKPRKDHSLHPLNTGFDLYSMGKDGKSQAPLTAKSSRDDVIWANDGGYVGLGTNY